MAMIDTRRVLIAVSLATGLSLLGDSAMYTVLPIRAAEIGVTLASIGILLSANRFIRIFLNGPVGYLTDRWPRRRIFIPAMFLGAFSTATYALAQDFWLLLLGRLLWGVAWAGIWVSGNTIVLDATQHDNRGRGVGAYQISFYLGAASGAILGGLLTDLIGFRYAMTIAAGLTLAGGLVAFFVLPETGGVTDKEDLTTAGLQENVIQTDKPQLVSTAALLGVNRLVIPGILTATFGLFLVQRLGETVEIGVTTIGVTTIAGLGLGLTTLVSMVAAPTAGSLSDRFNSRWSVASGGLSSGVAGFGLLAQGSPVTMLLGLPLIAVASGSNQGLSTSLIGDLTPRIRHGRRLGIFFTVGDFASAIGPPLAYALLPIIGLSALYGLCAVLFGIVLLIAVWWAARIKKRKLLPYERIA